MTDTLLYNLLDTKAFHLRLNQSLPKFLLIKELLYHNNIPVETWQPENNFPLDIIEMNFSAACKFQDVYLLAFILKEFGIKQIYPSRKEEPTIAIGTYFSRVANKGQFAIAEPIDINQFLSIDPKVSTEIAIASLFTNTLENTDDDYETWDNNDDYYESSYEKYGGYNGYDDDAIDNAFEGDPENTWNVD